MVARYRVIAPLRQRVGQRLRARLDDAGIYGVRATVLRSESAQLPFGGLTANLIVVASGAPPEVPAAEVYRVLRPVGGAFMAEVPAGQSEAWARWTKGSDMAQWSSVAGGGDWHRWIRGRLVGAGD